MTFSSIFDRIGSKLIVLKIAGYSVSPDLCIGMIIECFHGFGNTLVTIDVLIINVIYYIVTIRLSLICWRLFSSCPVDIVFLSFDIANITSDACTGWGQLPTAAGWVTKYRELYRKIPFQGNIGNSCLTCQFLSVMSKSILHVKSVSSGQLTPSLATCWDLLLPQTLAAPANTRHSRTNLQLPKHLPVIQFCYVSLVNILWIFYMVWL